MHLQVAVVNMIQITVVNLQTRFQCNEYAGSTWR